MDSLRNRQSGRSLTLAGTGKNQSGTHRICYRANDSPSKEQPTVRSKQQADTIHPTPRSNWLPEDDLYCAQAPLSGSKDLPRRRTKTEAGTHQALKNVSYESMVVSWLMQDGWQVFLPILDHGHQTDILISDGPNYYRIQVKTFVSSGKDHVVHNAWEGSNVDLVIFLARNGNWGVIAPAFSETKRKLHCEGHRKFERNRKSFLREFHQI